MRQELHSLEEPERIDKIYAILIPPPEDILRFTIKAGAVFEKRFGIEEALKAVAKGMVWSNLCSNLCPS